MSRISASHIAGLDLVDKLFFNQILVRCLFTEEIGWLKDLDADLNRELTHKGITGVQRQVVRHGVLSRMEAGLSEPLSLLYEVFPDKLPALRPENVTVDQYEQIQRHTLDYFQTMVLVVLEKCHQCDMQMVIEITDALLGKYKKAPATLRYRLVERMFSYEFENAPIDCFTWLAKMGVLKSDKHPGKVLEDKYIPEFLQRLSLLCELEMVCDFTRRPIGLNVCVGSAMVDKSSKDFSQKTIKLLHAQDNKVQDVKYLNNLNRGFPILDLNDLEDPISIQRYFSAVNSYAIRFRVFQGSLASWIGMLCGGYVEILDRQQDQKKPISIFYAGFEGKSLNKTMPKEKPLTLKISKEMSLRGFEITPRTIYEHHRDFKETILKIVTEYYNMKLVENVAIPPYVNDITYGGSIPHFVQLKPKLRRHPHPQV
jgi:hypothetical protein